MALVYRAIDLKHRRPAAVKVMQADLARTSEFRARFERMDDRRGPDAGSALRRDRDEGRVRRVAARERVALAA
jgi:hypothetical protein